MPRPEVDLLSYIRLEGESEMFLDRDYDSPVPDDGPIGGENFGAMDFGPQEIKVPEWFDMEFDPGSEEFLSPGSVKQAEDEDAPHFLTDTPRDAFTDRATQEVMRFEPDMNPTFLVGREYLLSDKSDLIRDSATLMKDVMNDLRPVIFSRQPNLTKIVTTEVSADGHVFKGETVWTVEISAANQPGIHRTQQSTPIRKMRVEIPMRITEGHLVKPKIFYTASSRPYPLTIEGCQLALKWRARSITKKRSPNVDLAQMPERDYRAF